MATKSCKETAVGLTRRNCTNESWEKEISSCVNAELHKVQQAVEVSFFNIHSSISHCWPDLPLILNACFPFIITDVG